MSSGCTVITAPGKPTAIGFAELALAGLRLRVGLAKLISRHWQVQPS
jgi:hypothetical protein